MNGSGEHGIDLKHLANAVPQLVWIAEPDGRVTYYNDRISDYAGARKTDENTWEWAPMVHPEDTDKTLLAWKTAVETKQIYACDHRVLMKNGQYRYHLSRGYPQFDDAGEVIKWYGTATDIHEQKEAQALLEQYAFELSRQVEARTVELRNQKEFAEALLDSSVDVIAVYDSHGRLKNANRKFFEKHSLTKSDSIDKHASELFPHSADLLLNITTAFTGKELFIPAEQSENGTNVFESYFVPVGGISETTAVMVIEHDVTSNVKAAALLRASAEQLKSANELLLRKNEELEQFAYAASHDLQEPLRKVTTFARMLEKSWGENPQSASRYIEKIIQSSDRMSELIKGVLTFSLLSRKDGFEKTDLNSIINNILTDLELLIEQKGAKIICTKLPLIEAIPSQMNQLFYNLISNSLKFARMDTPPVIEISCDPISVKGSGVNEGLMYYRITVKDNGVGFNQNYADKIFQMFQRLNSRHEYSGSGIGLAIVKKITGYHQGLIEAESVEGYGSKFHVVLPEAQPVVTVGEEKTHTTAG